MGKSSSSKSSGKPRKPQPDTRKPRPDFPLTPHPRGYWCKKVRGKLHCFGPLRDPEAALAKWLQQKDDLLAGRTPRVQGDGLTIRELVNKFLTSKRLLVGTDAVPGELSMRSWNDYHRCCMQTIVPAFGKTRLVTDLAADDFDRLKAKLAAKAGPVTVGNEVNRIRVVFNWAYKQGLIEKALRFGPAFVRPSKRTLRLEKAKKGERMFEAEALLKILEAAPMPLRGMILLGVNAGLGNTDIANLQTKQLDLKRGWLDFPRPKTGIGRRCPLWPETLEAVREAIAARPKPKQLEDADCVFLTVRGERCVLHRIGKDEHGQDKPGAKVDAVTRHFGELLRTLKLNRDGVGFYALRHTFETIAGESRDQVAVDVVMGHADPSMGAVYRERVGDDRLQAVVNVVRAWLWPKPGHDSGPAILPFAPAVG
jgi:integrase